MKSTVITLVLLVSIVLVGVAQEAFRTKSYDVGFSSSIEIDQSRPSTMGGQLGRVIQINIWYPAQTAQDSIPMLFSDYLKVKSVENGPKSNLDYKKTVENYFQWPLSQGASKSLLDSLSSATITMKAIRTLAFAPGRHPVILLMHGSAIDFAFLGESLAELGYIAINVPVKGYLQQALDVNGIGMETEIRDFEFAMSVLSGNRSLNLTNVTALGFSFGGQSALGLACRNPNIKMVISYDGGIGDRFGARLIDESTFCLTENISAPILHIYDASYTQRYLDKMRSFVYAQRTFIGLNKIAHWHFTSFGYLASRIPQLFGENDFAKNGYETILEITKSYLGFESKNSNSQHSFDDHNLVNAVEHLEAIRTK